MLNEGGIQYTSERMPDSVCIDSRQNLWMHNHSCLEFSFLDSQDQVHILIIGVFEVYSGSSLLDGHMLIEYLLGLNYMANISAHHTPVVLCLEFHFSLWVSSLIQKYSAPCIFENKKKKQTMVTRVHYGLIDLIQD